jgi:ABC-type glycerol-3-phosphate transport system substrate-binding protein
MKVKETASRLLVLILATQVILTGCSEVKTETAGKPADKGENTKPVTIKLFSAHGQFNKGFFGYKEVEAFMKANPNIKVEVTYANGKQWVDTFQALAATNELPDVFQPTTFTFSEMLQNKWIQPLDGLVQADFKSRFAEGTFLQGINMNDGKIYTFPRIVAKKGRELVYNKDVMKKAGLDPEKPPKTWEELYQMSKQVKEKTGIAGLVMPMKEADGFADMLAMSTPLHPTLDQGFDLKTGRYAYDSPAVIKTFDFINKMNKEGLLHPNSLTLGLTDAQGVFANKQAAFTFNQHWIVRVLELELDKVKDFGIADVPVPEQGMKFTQLGSSADQNAYISSSTKYPKEAAKLIDWLSSKEYYTRQMKEDYLLAPMPDLYKDAANFPKPELKEMADSFSRTVIEKPVPEKKSEVTEVRKLEAAIAKPKPAWSELMQAALLGKGNIQEELKKYTVDMNKRLDDAIKQGQDKGLKVSKEDFASPQFDGKKDFKN